MKKSSSNGTKTAIRKRAGASSSSRNSSTARKSTTSRKSANTSAAEDEGGSPFEQLFTDMLKETLWAEQHLVEALRNLSEAASTIELQDAFEDHLFITQKHVNRLEKVFSIMGKPAEPQKCEAMEALVKEAEKIIKKTPEGSMTRDAGLIICAQKVEHYEIATYGSLVQVALTLGEEQAAYILEKTLVEEEQTDRLLTEIAETGVNPMADVEDQEELVAELEEV